MKIKVFPIVLFSLLAIASCGKIESLPPEPHIEYTSFTVFDTTDLLGNTVMGGRLKFYFEDGDGDLGLTVPENVEEADTINLFVALYRINDGLGSPAPDNEPYKPSGFRIPYMDRTGQNKILRGTISVEFSYLFYSEEDTIKYDFYIRDRAGNLSNTASTSVIPVFYPGVYEE
ncbi:MAG: hypothetical protein E4H43_04555 [Bacteroidia bacterium]|nr:MAG: hypothetical protein E4H43_04555 [Bacteroidia bacterium]